MKYIGYLEKYNNHLDLQYMTGYQKFLELTTRYKKYEAEYRAKAEIALVPTRAKEIAEKVRSVKTQYNESEYQRHTLGYKHKELHFKSFVGCFKEEEIAILKKIGNLGKCLRLQGSVSGEDALEVNLAEILKSIAIVGASTKNVLENKMSENVAKLAKSTIRKF